MSCVWCDENDTSLILKVGDQPLRDIPSNVIISQ